MDHAIAPVEAATENKDRSSFNDETRKQARFDVVELNEAASHLHEIANQIHQRKSIGQGSRNDGIAQFEVEEAANNNRDENPDDFPEGGRQAWLVVVSAMLCIFPSFGFMVSIGTLQEYWETHQLAAYTARDVGWIAGVFVYLSLALGIFVGPLFDSYGHKWIMTIGSTTYVAMIFLLAQCYEYWHFMLCCGLLGSIGGAALTTTSLAVVAHWFKAKRGLAQGLAMAGSSFGGLTIPLILQQSLPTLGYAWTVRVLAFIFIGCLIPGNLLMKPRLKPTHQQPRTQPRPGSKPRKMLDFSIFGDLRFSLLAISVFGLETVLFGALGILPTYASIVAPQSPQTRFYLISVLNGVSCFGRFLPGYIADIIGRFNTLFISICATLVFMLAVWLPFGATSLPALYAFVAIFGFGTGSWMALVPATLGQLCRADEFGRYYGTMYFLASLSTLICIPISGQLVQSVGPSALVGFYSVVLGLALVAFAFSRWACLNHRWTWRAKI